MHIDTRIEVDRRNVTSAGIVLELKGELDSSGCRPPVARMPLRHARDKRIDQALIRDDQNA